MTGLVGLSPAFTIGDLHIKPIDQRSLTEFELSRKQGVILRHLADLHDPPSSSQCVLLLRSNDKTKLLDLIVSVAARSRVYLWLE